MPKVENRQQIKDKVELFGAYAPHLGKLILEDFSLKNLDSLIQFIEVVKKRLTIRKCIASSTMFLFTVQRKRVLKSYGNYFMEQLKGKWDRKY